MKKILFRILVLTVALGMLTACGNSTSETPASTSVQSSVSSAAPTNSSGDSNSSVIPDEGDRFNAPGEFPIIKETATLTIALPANANVENYDTNKYTELLKEKVNVDITFELMPAALDDARQKLALDIASSSALPDVIILNLNDIDVMEYGYQGAFIPLNDMYDNLSFFYKNAIADNNDTTTLELLTYPNGNMYSLPKLNCVTGNVHSHLAWINDTWLTALDKKMPETTEELYDVLKAFKTEDPNGNGKADEIPMVGSGSFHEHSNPFAFLMSAFINVQPGNQEKYLSVKDGVVYAPYDKPEWLEGLKYMNRLVSEGLLDPVTFTQDLAQNKALLEYEETAIVGSFSYINFAVYSPESERMKDMVSLPPITGPDGVCTTPYFPATPVQYFFITRDCADPEAAFMVGDYMLSHEATVWTRFGEVDVDYKEADDNSQGVYYAVNPDIKLVLEPILVWGSVQNANWADETPKYRAYNGMDVVWNGNPWDQGYVKANAIGKYIDAAPKEVISGLVMTEEELSQLRDITGTLITFIEETSARMITGNESFDFWDTYLEELERIGSQTYVEIAQTAYDRMYK